MLSLERNYENWLWKSHKLSRSKRFMSKKCEFEKNIFEDIFIINGTEIDPSKVKAF